MTSAGIAWQCQLADVAALLNGVNEPCAEGVQALFEIRAMRQCSYPTGVYHSAESPDALVRAYSALHADGALTDGGYGAAIVKVFEKRTGLVGPYGKGYHPYHIRICGVDYPV